MTNGASGFVVVIFIMGGIVKVWISNCKTDSVDDKILRDSSIRESRTFGDEAEKTDAD